MKHRAARLIYKKISKLSREDELEYQRQQIKELRKQKVQAVKKERKKSISGGVVFFFF